MDNSGDTCSSSKLLREKPIENMTNYMTSCYCQKRGNKKPLEQEEEEEDDEDEAKRQELPL